MTLQEIFDTVVTHLRKQGERAMVVHDAALNGCAYRGDRGTMCAAGVPHQG